MKPRPLPQLVLAFALAAFVATYHSAGCISGNAPSPTRQVAVAQNVYSETLNMLSDLRDAGQLSTDQQLEIEKARIVAATALDLAKNHARTGVTSPSEALARFYAAISDINKLLPEKP